MIPNDRVQARAAAVVVRDSGIRRLFVVHDGEVYGRGTGRLTARAARARGVRVVAILRLGRHGRGSRAIARRRGGAAPTASSTAANGAVRLWRALARTRR